MDGGTKPSLVTLKKEQGGYKRLPSFRTPRDLKLTEFQKSTSNLIGESKSKKVYLPNLNVQRKRGSEAAQKPPSSPLSNGSVKSNVKDSSKSEERGKRDGGRKKSVNFIQASGVFSEGLAPSIKSGRWSLSRYSDASTPSMLERPKLNTSSMKVDKDKEASVMKELLRDDFIDDPAIMPDLKQCPINLPLKLFGGDIYAKKEEDDLVSGIHKVKVKTEAGVEVEEVKPRSLTELTPLTVRELLNHSADKSYIFCQLPHYMPKEKSYVPATTAKASAKNQPQKTQPEPDEKSTLSKLPGGRIGKLQILKSGRARLVLGDVNFFVDPGTQAAFRQELLAVELNPNSQTGNMINLGNVSTRMIFTPDWESLLN